MPREFECMTPDTALVRELHVYGNVLRVGNRESSKYHEQHRGIGTNLLKYAERTARNSGYNYTAVISGIGVTEYYRKRGYVWNDYYMVKSLAVDEEQHITLDTDLFAVLMLMFMMTATVCSMLVMHIP